MAKVAAAVDFAKSTFKRPGSQADRGRGAPGSQAGSRRGTGVQAKPMVKVAGDEGTAGAFALIQAAEAEAAEALFGDSDSSNAEDGGLDLELGEDEVPQPAVDQWKALVEACSAAAKPVRKADSRVRRCRL